MTLADAAGTLGCDLANQDIVNKQPLVHNFKVHKPVGSHQSLKAPPTFLRGEGLKDDEQGESQAKKRATLGPCPCRRHPSLPSLAAGTMLLSAFRLSVELQKRFP